jgi:hypothetical protein
VHELERLAAVGLGVGLGVVVNLVISSLGKPFGKRARKLEPFGKRARKLEHRPENIRLYSSIAGAASIARERVRYKDEPAGKYY